MILAKCPNCGFGFDRKAVAASYVPEGHHLCPRCFSTIGPSFWSGLIIAAAVFGSIFAVVSQSDLDIGPQLLLALLPALTLAYYLPRAGIVFHFRNVDDA